MDAIFHPARRAGGRACCSALRLAGLALAGLAAAAALAAPGSPQPAALGATVPGPLRWILTPAQRAAIERARRAAGDQTDASEGDPSGPWQIQGLVQAPHTAGSVWINGQLLRAGDHLGAQVRLRAVGPDRVILEREGRLIALRPGQTLQPDGQVSDLLPPRTDWPAPTAPLSKDLTGAPPGQRSP
ncbi:MAG: general secretion pathway protein GspB [Tepidimonas sp.]|uniref:general secretion pathway protein GspB n=1 Tax=Tepidimonas sp. TaxID=2002775 RepID=UPI00259FA477|nr:general secretion pathway protein GspB [Tepidimonas sp.]MDM7456419.1 general secretion pathway protein GspB [Tepidimonas sp.]